MPKGLNSNVVSDASCSFLTPKSKFDLRSFSVEAGREHGRGLSDQDCISLIFLLVDDIPSALEYSLEILNGKYEKPVGSNLLESLVLTGKQSKMENWPIKVACALHLIRKYKILRDLLGFSRKEALMKFDACEYLYLKSERVQLYKLANSLQNLEGIELTKSILEDTTALESHLLNGDIEKSCLEINFLHILKARKLTEEQLIVLINAHFPDSLDVPGLELRAIFPSYKCNDSDCETLKQGKCIILSNEHFEKRINHLKNREGNKRDVEELKKAFEALGCEIKELHDLKKQQMEVELSSLATTCDFFSKDDDYIVVCLLSHGDKIRGEEVIYGTDGEGMEVEKIIRLFSNANKAPLLSHALKIFIIQACRGSKDGETIPRNFLSTDGKQPSLISSSVPAIKDYIVFYSTISDYASYRNIKEGTFFIQMFCKELNENAYKKNVEDLLNGVMENVARGGTGQRPEKRSTYAKKARFVKRK